MLRGLNWNVEWARRCPSERIASEINDVDPDIICLTEVPLGLIPSGGYHILGSDDWGYSHDGTRRKVALWSRSEWSCVEAVSEPLLPGGRFVSGVTARVRFVGVCIPWRDAHVRGGRRDRARWEDHVAFLRGFRTLLEDYRRRSEPICLLGDFNQRIPRKWVPQRVHDELLACLGDVFTVSTAGLRTPDDRGLIDHVAITPPLTATIDRLIDRVAPDGTILSDHDGVVFSLDR